MTKITPTEYLAEHLQTWDYGDKIKFIAVLSEVLTAFEQSGSTLAETLLGIETGDVRGFGRYREVPPWLKPF